MATNSFLKKALSFAFAVAMSQTMVFAATSPYEHRQQRETQNSQGMMDRQEQNFASELSDLHRQVFMHQFNGMQRAEAMALVEAERGKRYGKKMTPDMAVEEVMKNHRGVRTGQGKMYQDDENNSSRYSGSSKSYKKRYKNRYDQYNEDKQYNDKRSNDYNSNQDRDRYSQDDSDRKSSKKKWWESDDDYQNRRSN